MLSKLGSWIIKHHWIVLIVAVVLTIGSLAAMTRLTMRMQIKDMMPEGDKEVELLDYALNNFKGMESVILAVEGDKNNIIAFIKEVVPKLEKLPGVDSVTYKTEVDFVEKNGLLLVDDTEDLENTEGMLTAASLKDFVKGLNDNFETTYTESGDSEKLSKDKTAMLMMLSTLNDFIKTFGLKNVSREKLLELSNEFVRGPTYMVSHDGSMGLVLVRTSIDLIDVEGTQIMVDGTRSLLEEYGPKHNVTGGVAGNLAIQRDEMIYTERDMRRTSLVAMLAILAIFYFGFRIMRLSLLAAVPMVLGIIWAMGFTAITIGNLNIFTAMMGAILIGLGIDYAIHIFSLYTEMRSKGQDVHASLQAVFDKVAKGIVTGAVTTALGFFVFILSSFKAFKEFGFVLGSGIIFTLLASIFVLPALIKIFPFKPMKFGGKLEEEISLAEKFLTAHARWIIGGVVLLLVVGAFGIPKVRFTSDWLDIEPVGMPSIETNRRIEDKFEFSSSYSMFVSQDLDAAARLKKKLDDLSTVGLIDSISQYMPESSVQKERLSIISKIKSRVPAGVNANLYAPQLKEELFRLQDNLIELSDLAYIGGEKRLVEKLDGIVESGVIEEALENVDKQAEGVRRFQSIFIENLQNKVRSMNSSKIITYSDVPKNIRQTYQGKDGKYLTIAYPTEDPWEYGYQQIHLAQLNSLKNETATGSIQMIISFMKVAAREGTRVLIYTVIFIYLILLLDFRSFKFATFAMLPMGLTLALMLGMMGWFGMTFNFVNILALPLIIGIGVDDGVHLIHRYLIENKIGPTIKSTGRAITLTTLTTVAAFGSMMLAQYRGFSSFAFLLSIGIALAYLTTLGLIPSLLVLFDRARLNNDSSAEGANN